MVKNLSILCTYLVDGSEVDIFRVLEFLFLNSVVEFQPISKRKSQYLKTKTLNCYTYSFNVKISALLSLNILSSINQELISCHHVFILNYHISSFSFRTFMYCELWVPISKKGEQFPDTIGGNTVDKHGKKAHLINLIFQCRALIKDAQTHL